MKRHLPWILTLLFAGWALGKLRPVRDGEFHFNQLSKIPVIQNGRPQPFDSLARNTLTQLREKQTANVEPWKNWWEKPRILSATEWLITMMTRPSEADAWPVFRINHPQLISLLKLPEADAAKQSDGKHYSWTQISTEANFAELQKQADSIRSNKKDPGQRDAFEQAVLKLHECMGIYLRMRNALGPQDSPDFARELAGMASMTPSNATAGGHLREAIRRYRDLKLLMRRTSSPDSPELETPKNLVRSALDKVIATAGTSEAGTPFNRETLGELLPQIDRFLMLENLEPPLLVAAASGLKGGANFQRMSDVGLGRLAGTPIPPSAKSWWSIADRFRSRDAAGFNASIHELLKHGMDADPKASTKASREVIFNRFAPFYIALSIYVIAFLLACGFWFNFAEWTRKSAFALITLALAIHTAGLLFRMILEGRPPVTNLYSSAIFIGWGSVILGLILEKLWKNAIGLVVASMLGFVTLVIAHNLALGGDTMVMMQAVLDTNFWLATHVVIVTLGYASTFVAGFLAIVYAVRRLLPVGLDDATRRGLSRMVYGIVCFATLFSFVGTVLGGIWADQSWGRFWGWDPKENGALIIVLWNALILHARWGGMIKDRGLMNLAIAGNIVTAWSWFGVNMLGIGLHSYGFMSGAFKWLLLFVLSQLILIGLGFIPRKSASREIGPDAKTAAA